MSQLLAMIGPGILVAATGVGAGDLATGALTGSKLGLAILWAVLVGAFLKYVLSEGLTRWQLATGDTLLEGCVKHFGRPVQWIFLVYLVVWSFLVGMALMSACGVASHAIFPLIGPQQDKIIYGIIHSAIAYTLVRLGGYQVFEKVMSVCIGIMFLVVVSTTIALFPPLKEIALGLFIPSIPQMDGEGLDWTIALLGGIGGSLTVVCYGYWIREENRHGTEDLKTCRIDLAAGYTMTAIFGICMVIIGHSLGAIEGGGATLVIKIADFLKGEFGGMGSVVKWAFLMGAWGAIFSSLLGVWQCIPYLFADFCLLANEQKSGGDRQKVDTKSFPYQAFLLGIATLPIIGMVSVNFTQAQKIYAIVGAFFIPMLALALFILNGSAKRISSEYKNSILTSAILAITFLFFIWAGWLGIQSKL